MNFAEPNLPVVSPEVPGPEQFTDARAAVGGSRRSTAPRWTSCATASPKR
jgi:hypothetical protein